MDQPNKEAKTTNKPLSNPEQAKKEWTEREKRLVVSLMEAIIEEGIHHQTGKKWEMISLRLVEHGVWRNGGSIKNKWNRELRALSGIDEQNHRKPNKMTTSHETKEQKQVARQKRKAAKEAVAINNGRLLASRGGWEDATPLLPPTLLDSSIGVEPKEVNAGQTSKSGGILIKNPALHSKRAASIPSLTIEWSGLRSRKRGRPSFNNEDEEEDERLEISNGQGLHVEKQGKILLPGANYNSASNARSHSTTMDNGDMDIDMDIDLRPLDDESINVMNDNNAITSRQQTSPIDATATSTPEKVHIRGLDDLTTGDIRAFAEEHFPHNAPARVEWVDDTSANLVFDDSTTAQSALESFTLGPLTSDVSLLSPVELREAKTLSTRPESRLQVRMALVTDQKRPKAYEASRFYMMHPEHDPREQRRRKEGAQRHERGEYRSRRYTREEERKRRYKDYRDGFDPSMYDDDNTSNGRGSIELSSDERAQGNAHDSRGRVDSYRPLRRRSASPDAQRKIEGGRRRTPPPSYKRHDPHPVPSQNRGKELFPSMSSNDTFVANRGEDLFSNKLLAVGLKKELFPHKTNHFNHHRRSDAFDAADETADLFANGLAVPLAEELTNRVSNSSAINGHLKATKSDSSESAQVNGIAILGAASQQSNGFSIKGGASAAGTIKELFPGKALGNEGKELFAEKLRGRGGRRNRAADMFH
ncbi:hypothetical protein ACLMJK_006677 [Lecanora helva]